MEKGTIAQWVAKDGDQVEKDQVILILETEKVAHELTAPDTGMLAVFGNVGEEYPCGTTVAVIAETREEYEAVKKDPTKYAAGQIPVSDETGVSEKESHPYIASSQGQQSLSGRIKISPLAKKLAQTHEIDPRLLKGSGPDGRIIKRDIEAAVEAKQQTVCQKPAAVSMVGVPPELAGVGSEKRVKSRIPLTGMRKRIAENLHQSTSTTARVTVMTEFDMTQMITLRDHYVQKAPLLGFKITYTDLFIYMVAKVLHAVPIINSSIIGEQITMWEDVNIGFGVSVVKHGNESGLLVPVIRNADQKSLGEISNARKSLMEKARAGTISLDELTGGTFTITNTGTFTPLWHIQTPIINQPEAAILGTSSIVERAVVVNKEIVIRPIMPLSFAFDHRIMDGAPPAKFIGLLQQMIEDPWMIMM
jgi:pyruvate dehydrogenase E2 component (dihydrolipoamide acetyltransferase)/2-oxoglutarate dehydrogenase E2 component (dihydrolipoamide succinyltransferase)